MKMATNASELMTIEQINSKLARELYILNGILVMYVFLGVVGNSGVTFIYGFRLKVRMDDKFFILIMAVVDTIVCLTGPAFSLVRNFYPVNFRYDGACRASWFFVRLMNGFSGLLILVIGIQRYLKVCRPTGKQMTTKLKKIVIVVTFVVNMVLHVPILFVFGVSSIPFPKANVTGYRCGVLLGAKHQQGQIYLMFMFVSAVLVMCAICVLYGVIGRKIYRHLRRMEALPRNNSGLRSSSSTPGLQDGSASHSQDGRESQGPSGDELQSNSTVAQDSLKKKIPVLLSRNRKNSLASVFSIKRNPFHYHRYSIMFLVISIITVLTYTPGLLDNLIVSVDSIEFWTNFHSGERNLHLFLFQFYLFNHVVNPLIYACFDSKFRRKALSILTCSK